MVTESDESKWIPLVEFSVKIGLSLSTLRRHIKLNKIPWKLVEGRYLVRADETLLPKLRQSSELENKLTELEIELRQAQEEVAELKSLVAIYEEKWAQKSPI